MSPKRVQAAKGGDNSKGGSNRGRQGWELDAPEYKTDEFRMFSLKVLQCSKRYCHDWTTCPFAHPAEKAARRDPRKFRYTGIACPEVKQGNQCSRGDNCPFSHNVFEYWLHPSRYRTQLCNIATSCNRKICFFAHTIEELRVPTPVGDPNALLSNCEKNVRNRDGERRGQSALGRASSSPQLTTQPTGISASQGPSLNLISSFQSLASTSATSRPTSNDESQARRILDSLRTARDRAYQSNQSTAHADLSLIEALVGILQQNKLQSHYSCLVNPHPASQSRQGGGPQDLQQIGAGHSPESLLGALHQQVATEPMLPSEREQFQKLLNWAYVQVVQRQQSVFGDTNGMEVAGQAHRSLADEFGKLTMGGVVSSCANEVGGGLPRRMSLGCIPEMTPAAPIPPILSEDMFWGGEEPGQGARARTGQDGGEVQGRRLGYTAAADLNLNPSLMSALYRMPPRGSNDSTLTAFSTPRNSAATRSSYTRSSVDSGTGSGVSDASLLNMQQQLFNRHSQESLGELPIEYWIGLGGVVRSRDPHWKNSGHQNPPPR